MSAPRHTPGPWFLREHDAGFAEIEGGSRIIADVSCTVGVPYSAEEKANARLIAAAPDLLEACKHALAYLEARGTYDTAEVAAPIRAAITKAEGSR